MITNINKFTTVGIDRNTVIRDGSKIKGKLARGYRSKTILKLPVGLRVEDNLELYYAQDLTSLPKGLVVLNDVDIRGCISLEDIPDDMIIGGMIHYDGNTHEKALDALEKRYKNKLNYYL